MLRSALLCLAVFASALLPPLAVASDAETWQPLFNGEDLTGWHTSPGGEWSVVDGAIVGTSPKSEKRHGLLITDEAYADFEVRLKFKVTSGDSGFYFRATPVKHNVGIKGFQVEVDHSLETGGLYETLGRAWVKKTDPKKMKDVYAPGEWSELRLLAGGRDVTVWINGTKTAELRDDPGATSGHFALQLHGGDTMDVAYKDIKLRAINTRAGPIKVACVGDSITFGAAIKDRQKNNYPAQLQGILGDRYAVTNLGVNGATMLKKGDKPYWKLKQYQAAQDLRPDIVIIKLGTNDTKPHNWKHKADYPADYIEMVETFQQLDSKPTVYVCYPAPVVGEQWGINDKAVREEVIPFIDKVAKQTKATIIDVYTPLKDKPELIPDKVHPNARGAAIIAQTVADAIAPKQEENE